MYRLILLSDTGTKQWLLASERQTDHPLVSRNLLPIPAKFISQERYTNFPKEER